MAALVAVELRRADETVAHVRQPVPSSQIVHIPWIVPPGRKLGLSPLECHAAIISAGLSSQEYADIRRGGGLPPSVIKNTERI
jgi:phage portal protein BeeE